MSITPRFRVPRCSGRHREAAIALYRALLTTCRGVPDLDDDQCRQLQNIVRNRFKEQIHTHSQRWLRVRFVAGYQAIDLLDAARAGDKTKTHFLLDLLEKTDVRSRSDPPFAAAYPKDTRRRMQKEAKLAARSNAPEPRPRSSLWDRLQHLDRLEKLPRVPHLANANGVPFLRLGKPQPESLSAYFARRVKQHQKFVDRKETLEAADVLAMREDEWDEILEPYCVDAPSGTSWRDAVALSYQQRNAWLTNDRNANRDMARKLQDIVDRKIKLARGEIPDAEQRRMSQANGQTTRHEFHAQADARIERHKAPTYREEARGESSPSRERASSVYRPFT